MSRFDSRMARQLRLLLLPALTGCMPAVTHGPQVNPGFNVGVLTAAEIRSTTDNERTLLPNVGLSFMHGWRNNHAEAGAFLLGVHIPVSLFVWPRLAPHLLQGDLYYQFPSDAAPGLDAGIGVQASYGLGLGYVQIGRIDEEGAGWYTTQGVLLERGRHTYPDDYTSHSVGWLPGLAYQTNHGGSETHFFANAIVNGARNHALGETDGRFSLMLGMIVFFSGRAESAR